MERRELNRMFDRLAPSPEQEQAVLDRLLQTERKVKPMKKLKKLTVVGIAAALMVISCAAAVVTGFDQRLADYFGADPEQVELLTPGAVPVDVTVEDNGATLHVSQVLMDRCSILILADFTAPEGTVLDMDEENDVDRCFGAMDWSVPDLLDKRGEIIRQGGWGWKTTVLDDGDPLDNHLTILFCMDLINGIQPEWKIGGISLHNRDLLRYDPERMQYITVYPGDWSCQVPLTWQDMGQSIPVDQVIGQLGGIDITLTELYLSPMTLRLQLESESPIPQQFGGGIGNSWLALIDTECVALAMRDGRTISLTAHGGSASDQDQMWNFQLDEITDPALLQGGTLTVNGQIIPLDGLAPVE